MIRSLFRSALAASSTAIALAVVLPTAPVTAQSAAQAPYEDSLSAAEARADIAALYDTMQAEHVDLFARRTRAEYDAKIAEIAARIDGPIARSAFHRMVQEALAFGRVGHAKSDAPFLDVMTHVQEGGTIIPLSVTYRGEAMLTDQWASEGDAMPPGSRVMRLGGLTLAEFERRARKLVSADTDRLLRAQIELGLPAYLFLVFGPRDTLEIEFIAPDGRQESRAIPARGFGEMYALQAARPVPNASRPASMRAFEDVGGGVFYIKPGPFFATEEERGEGGETYAIEPYRALVREAFAALADSAAKDLVIDLRGNPGGDASFSDLVVGRVADRPFAQSSRYELRAGPNTKAAWAQREPEGDGLGARIADALARAEPGERIAIEVPEAPPIADNAFSGRVFVIVDRHSYSNAAVVAAMMQDLGLATIMGEETADLATTYGATETFTLPASGVKVIYPKAFMVRPSGSLAVRGVVPDFAIQPNPVSAAEDRMLDTALTQIRLTR